MEKVKWTDEQLAAIEHRNSTLLVSAAAGSGKTAVLVERLLRRVIDDREDISRFLMITYTNAAASELREKILTALNSRAAEAGKDAYIRRQLTLAHSANISTIHSFCTGVLRTHGHLIGLPGDFKILDEGEGSAIREQLCNEVVEKCYGEEWFLPAARELFGDRDDRELGETILMLYEKSCTQIYPEKWLDMLGNMFENSVNKAPEETVWGKYLLEQADKALDAAVVINKSGMESIQGDEKLEKAYLPNFINDAQIIKELKISIKGGWGKAEEAFRNVSFSRLGALRNYGDDAIKNLVTGKRDRVKGIINDIYKKWFKVSGKELMQESERLAPTVKALTRAVGILRECFAEEKLRRGVLDYSDLEHYALKILVENYDGENDVVTPTPLARMLSADFTEIMVDEYQDSNCIQDVIFRSISKDERNIVMVGDIKQSIYRFRLADPGIFLKKYKSFKAYGEAGDGEPCRVNLTRNFRSRRQVLEGCNSMFAAVMSERLGDIKYTPDVYLNPKAKYEEYPEQSNNSQAVFLDLTCSGEEKTEDELSPAAREIEADWIAREIKSMLNKGFSVAGKDGKKRQMRAGDVVILLRSMSGKAHIYEKALASYGIPCEAEKKAEVITSPEVTMIISILTAIDNPLNEIALVGALRSPLFAFSADDLSRLKITGGSFISAVESLSRGEDETGEKCRYFLRIFYRIRELSEDLSCDRLIWELYRETNALGLAGALPGGEARCEKLLCFYRYARSFEQGGYRGLYAFLERISRLAKRGEDIPAPAGGGGDAVRIMSIHKSKGLEFPVVFVADFNHRFNNIDSIKRVIVHPELGIGMNTINEKYRSLHPVLARFAVSEKLTSEMKSEEMRVLYVALTRAREKLIVVCTLTNAERNLKSIYSGLAAGGGEFTPEELSSSGPLPWLAAPLLCSNEGSVLREAIGAPNIGGYDMNFDISIVKLSFASGGDGEEMQEVEADMSMGRAEDFARRFEYEYPYKEAADVPSKVTATGLRTLVEENCISAEGLAEPEEKMQSFNRPEFLKESGLTPAEKGIAAHLVMQLIDFRKCTDGAAVKEELARLYANGQLTLQQYEAVKPETVMGFFTSDIGKEVISAEKLEREFRFSVLVPAEHLAPDEKMLLQGVIDLFYEKDGGLVLLDFKTDRKITEEIAKERYATQLQAYSYALEQITGKKVLRRILFFLQSGSSFEL